jgi:imidazolonepropionase-like amidohydrolase
MSTTTQDTSIVIAAERIWDGTAEAPSAGEVLIQDGCISDLGASVAHPPGAPVIELKDHTLTPGFIDCHVHTTVLEGVFDNVYMDTVSQKTLFALNAFYILLGNGFTTVRDVGCFDPSFITVSLRNAQAAGQIIGPSLLVAPHLLSARGGHGDTTVLVGFQFDPLEFNVADGEAAIIEAVRRDYRGGADWIKFAATGGFSTPSDDPSQTTYS